MKQLRFMDDDGNYGFMETTCSVGLSLSALFRAAKNEKELLINICIILHHEWLHYAIEDMLIDNYLIKEELIVERLSFSDPVQTKPVKELYWITEVEDD